MIEHVLMIVSSTMTAARFNNSTRNMTCSASSASCENADAMATLQSAMIPVVIAFCALIVIHLSLPCMKTWEKIQQLKHGTAQLALLAYPIALLLVAFEYQPAVTTVTVQHAVAFILWSGLQDDNMFHRVVFMSSFLGLLLYAWQEGLPMPVFENPGVSISCSTKAHLIAIVSTGVVLPAIGWVAGQLHSH